MPWRPSRMLDRPGRPGERRRRPRGGEEGHGKAPDLTGAKEGGNVIGGVAGLTADANSLINHARTIAQRHLLTYNEDIPVEILTERLCDMKQGYTNSVVRLPHPFLRSDLTPMLFFLHSPLLTGLRPFGVSLLYATCIGANNGTAQSLLKQEYKDDIEVKDAIGLVLRVMSKTMDSTTLGSEKCECWFLS
ncbi:N-terminal nucleophile aminohydrolase [Salix suchowensis]|nr:N-terminal nucleophile aminohydrolase [Salix suchowensis]